MKRAVFLDRDGVLNQLVLRDGRAVSPRTNEEFVLLPGIAEATARLKQAGFLIVIVTNQPDIARGFLTPSELDRMHGRLRRAAQVDAIYVCPHDDPDGCPCRKPKPGLLLRAAEDWQIRLEESWIVGDSWKDLEAGRVARCNTCLVRTLATDEKASGERLVRSNLQETVEAILSYLREGKFATVVPRNSSS